MWSWFAPVGAQVRCCRNGDDFDEIARLMGGPGSGRKAGRHDDEVWEHAALDVRDLARTGALEYGDHEVSVLNSGMGATVFIRVPRLGIVAGGVVRIGYIPGSFVTAVEFEYLATKLPSGAARPWFLCNECGRRSAIIYLRLGHWRCRVCHKLRYPSTRLSPVYRGLEQARATRVKLGGGPGCGHEWPDKPQRMRWDTYFRLRREVLDAEWRWIRTVKAPRFERFRRAVAALTGDDW